MRRSEFAYYMICVMFVLLACIVYFWDNYVPEGVQVQATEFGVRLVKEVPWTR
jgi:hypothetical protein